MKYINYNIFTSTIVFFIGIILNLFNLNYLNNSFWFSNSIGSLFAYYINDNIHFNVSNNINIIIELSSIFFFQIITNFILFNNFNILTFNYLCKIITYIILYLFFNDIGNKYIHETKTHKKKYIVSIIKSLCSFIGVEILIKQQMSLVDFSTIGKLITSFIIYYKLI